tara:strand:- start:2204 stop:2428 length:225 start_codon:yes stop_codon:yes gene_type:complete
MLGLSSLQTEKEEHVQMWFARVELINYLSGLAVTALVVIVLYRGYQEYWVPKQRRAALKKILLQLYESDDHNTQ